MVYMPHSGKTLPPDTAAVDDVAGDVLMAL